MNKFLLIVFLSVFFTASFSQGYKIKGEIKNMQDTTAILAYYFGGKQYATDTTDVVKGKLTFSGDKELEGGIYLVVLPGGKYFELIISEQKFSFTTDKNDLVASMNFKNSRENTAFYQYLNFISVQQQKVAPLKEKLSSAKEDEKKKIQKEINEVDNTVRDYREDFQSRYKDVFFSKIISATTDIVIPETPLDSTGKPKENFSFYYFKNHFWDNMDFSDKRMLRTPVFFNKMDKYLEKLSPKHPDSIIVSADIMIEKARANKEVFQYVVSYITSTYERSKIMGMDAVFVHMVEKYYMTAQCDWVKEKQLEKIIERAKRISPNMIGKKPPNLVFKDTSNQYHSLYHLQAKYTLLFFYDPDCGHCKKETPKVKAVCDSLVSAGIDIKVFAVNTEFDIKKWKEFIKKFDVGNWINVGDIQFDKEGNPVATSNWREQYDIHSTPVIYLLNKDKEIIAKRINDKQIVKIIEREVNLEK
jgi:thiol-disulfide isomerase/thioredoxin